MRHESQKIVVYDNIQLIQLGRRPELIADLEKRTGIRITRIEIGKIDFLKDTVLIKIHFYEDEQPDQMDDSFTGIN
jgi:hypothetical protein